MPRTHAESTTTARNISMPYPSRLHIGQQPAAHDHPGPGYQDQGGDPFGAHRGVLSGLDGPKPFGHGKIQNRNRPDGDESDLRHERDLVQIAERVSLQDKHAAEDIHHDAKDSQWEQPVHGGERHRFPKAQHAQRHYERGAEYQRETEEMHGLPGYEPQHVVYE